MQALVKRFEGQPFDILGINTDGDKEQYKRDCISEGVTWRSTWEGREQAVVKQWGVSAFPTIYVLDGKGVIRFKNSRGEGLERDVATLMAELVEEPTHRDAGVREAGMRMQGGEASGLSLLLTEHAAADAEWKEAMLGLRGKERRALRKLNPASKFLAGFQTVADAGSGRAKLWLAMNMADATDLKSSELKEALAPLYGELCHNFARAEFASQTLDALIAEKRRLDGDDRAKLLRAFAVNCKNHALEGVAIGAELAYYQKSKDKDELALAVQLTEQLFDDYLDTEAGAAIWGARNKGSFEGVGNAAPDFPAVDTKGNPFRLSDYKGQVVMLDFWGFW